MAGIKRRYDSPLQSAVHELTSFCSRGENNTRHQKHNVGRHQRTSELHWVSLLSFARSKKSLRWSGGLPQRLLSRQVV
eukprot:scaffold15238_cov214-Alexandrium_tamarense.AAC.2